MDLILVLQEENLSSIAAEETTQVSDYPREFW